MHTIWSLYKDHIAFTGRFHLACSTFFPALWGKWSLLHTIEPFRFRRFQKSKTHRYKSLGVNLTQLSATLLPIPQAYTATTRPQPCHAYDTYHPCLRSDPCPWTCRALVGYLPGRSPPHLCLSCSMVLLQLSSAHPPPVDSVVFSGQGLMDRISSQD